MPYAETHLRRFDDAELQRLEAERDQIKAEMGSGEDRGPWGQPGPYAQALRHVESRIDEHHREVARREALAADPKAVAERILDPFIGDDQ